MCGLTRKSRSSIPVSLVSIPSFPTSHALIPPLQKAGEARATAGSHMNRMGYPWGYLYPLQDVRSWGGPLMHLPGSMPWVASMSPMSTQLLVAGMLLSHLKHPSTKQSSARCQLQLSARLKWPLLMGFALHSPAGAAPGHFTKHLGQ